MKNEQQPEQAVTPMLQDFKDAYDRLKQHKPRDRDNALLLEEGKLRINKLTLAREAGHSRTSYVNHEEILRFADARIGKKERIRREIPSLETANAEYRELNGNLSRKVSTLQTQMAELVCYIDYLERKFKVKPADKVDWQVAVVAKARARKNPDATKDNLSRRKSKA